MYSEEAGIQSYTHQRQQCVTCMVTSTKHLMKISFNGVKDKQPLSPCNKTCIYRKSVQMDYLTFVA